MEPIDFARAARRRQATARGPAGSASATAPVAPPSDERRTFRFLIERYLQYHHRLRHAPGTVIIYQDTLDHFVTYFERHGWNTTIDDQPRIIREHARAWMDDLHGQDSVWGRPYSAATLHQFVRCARAFSNWLCEEEYTDFHYLAKLERPKLASSCPERWPTANSTSCCASPSSARISTTATATCVCY
jgi:site-specific recombinase XerD